MEAASTYCFVCTFSSRLRPSFAYIAEKTKAAFNFWIQHTDIPLFFILVCIQCRKFDVPFNFLPFYTDFHFVDIHCTAYSAGKEEAKLIFPTVCRFSVVEIFVLHTAQRNGCRIHFFFPVYIFSFSW